MIILGIDPGTATTGFGVIEMSKNGDLKLIDYGCISTPPTQKLPERLHQISKDLEEIITATQPDTAAVEEIFFSKNVKTAIHVAHARGAILQKLSEHHLETQEYKPNQVKEAVCGYGQAEKKQVQRMVQILLNMEQIPRPDDAADALAVAICHANHAKMKLLTQS